jgi:hypothetical protein
MLALALFALRLLSAIHDPFFEGDPGQRMLEARLPVAAMGNRIWLPWLQIHIWLFHVLNLPYYLFKIIPCAYFFIALVFLGLLAGKESGKTSAAWMFTLLLLVCFAYQFEIQFLSTRLYQEPLAVAGFYFLLWAAALERKYQAWLLPIGAIALLTRECFWIYLFALSLLDWKNILAQKKVRLAFATLWSVPVFWLLVTFWLHRRLSGKLPSSAAQWPLGINKQSDMAVSHLAGSANSFLQSLISSRAIFLLAALIIVWVIGRLCPRETARRPHPSLFDQRFRPFSLLSLGILYALIVLFNPWEATFANQRMVIPLLAHAFIWAPLLFKDTSSYPRWAKILSRIILVAGLILSLNLDLRTWIYRSDAVDEHSVAQIAGLVAAPGRNRPANVCVVNENYWDALGRLAGPLLYARFVYHPPQQDIAKTCDVIIAGPGFAPPPDNLFEISGDYQLSGRSYATYRRIAGDNEPH